MENQKSSVPVIMPDNMPPTKKPYAALSRLPGRWLLIGYADTELEAEAMARKFYYKVWLWWGPTVNAEKLLKENDNG
jgi:hypothetical protein